MEQVGQPAPFLELSDDIVTLSISPDDKRVIVHRAAIIKASPVLANKLRPYGLFDNGPKTMIHVEEQDMPSFQLLLHFAYTGQLPKTSTRIDIDTFNHSQYPAYVPLAKAYFLGDKYQNEAFKNAVLDTFVVMSLVPDNGGLCYQPGPHAINVIYHGTNEGSLLRKLVVDMYIAESEAEHMFGVDWPPQFPVELAAKLMGERKSRRFRDTESQEPEGLRGCDYHKHAGGERCDGRRAREREES
ncbi:uncharacterized protein LTR77_002923 [Saxophila tyrrhenica]|uniref:BTB domain-containing protein n=1 Tax=Saxophila tyrrhenica TaxID=1690608 RepID=A0AAV9PKF3_9PEZI|nr:hypothetical protein LTR77_002923 [Saxophila tyrrhenica]